MVSQLFGQGLMGFIVFCDHQQTRGVLIDPMDNARTDHAIDRRQVRQMIQQRVHQRAVLVSRRRVNHQPHRLVDNGQILILIDNLQGNVLGLNFQLHGRRQFKLHFIARFELMGGFDPAGIDQQPVILNQALYL
ncbi:hypothetical protein SDC9_119723 [bioreactor metagenome]|uniref:Uncharacterized protein n=1 Tax=bioreactor metagenome TaxID=1076179 RepID=A0A645C6G2_9ZZZZ